MKKTIFILAVILCATTFSAHAQQKYGHINSNEIMQMMPGVDSLQIKLMDFQKDLESIYQSMMAEFQTKKEKFDREAGTMSNSVRQIREKELVDLQTRIQEFANNVQDDLAEKQYELAKPFQDKILNAINEVSKEQKYTYIFDTQTLLYSAAGDDITPLVKTKLGIK